MINKRKLQQTKDLHDFLTLENDMLMSWQNYNEHLNCLRLCARDERLSDNEDEFNFYLGMIKEHKDDMREQLKWLNSEERYQLMECLAQSDFVKSIFKMKRGEK